MGEADGACANNSASQTQRPAKVTCWLGSLIFLMTLFSTGIIVVAVGGGRGGEEKISELHVLGKKGEIEYEEASVIR